MGNIERATQVIADARARGATEFCVCAGSRNAPLLAALSVAPDIKLWSFVDERSAAFFALGIAKRSGHPAAVVTTSGTAAAELLPAAIEAHYSGTPLILITADRPARFRGTGAPQAIEQEGLFGVYATRSVVHVNVELDEPLIDEPLVWRGLSSPRSRPPEARAGKPALRVSEKPVVIVGGLADADRDCVKRFLLRLRAPVYLEPLSGLREDDELQPIAITAGERMLARGGFASVIRIGNVPTLRFWRDLDEKLRAMAVVSYSALPFAGLSRGEVHPIEALDDDVAPQPAPQAFFDDDREKAQRIAEILDSERDSELAMFRTLSQSIDGGARIYLGNSLPIREWDLAATRAARGLTIAANRGANGIDGQLSTFFGQCDRERMNVCVVGDLTAIYDMNAPWIVPQLPRDLRFRIVIVNNGGGRIFSRVASLAPLDPAMRQRIIENAHAFRFDGWARMWNIEDRVVELVPDAAATARAWRRYDALW